MDSFAALQYGARLPIHIDVEEHYVEANDYITALKSFNTTLFELNKRLFAGQLDCELLIYPAEEGSLKSITSVAVKGAWKIGKGLLLTTGALATILTISDSNSAERLLKGLTQQEIKIEDHYEELGELIRELIIKIYTIENDELERKIDSKVNLDKVIKAKSDFYLMCYKNEKIMGVGFDDEEHFPVLRHNFLRHVSKDKVRPLDSYYRIYNAIVISPVDVDKETKWEFQDTLTKTSIKAYMKDKNFKRDFLNGKYPLKETKEDDLVQILVAYKRQEKNGDVEIIEINIETVYSFNEKSITPIPQNLPANTEFILPKSAPMDKLWGT